MSLVSSVRLNLEILGCSKILMLLFPLLTSHKYVLFILTGYADVYIFIWVILIDVFVQGSMATILFDSKAIKIFVVMNGAGQLEMACPYLAHEHGQGQQGRGGVQEGQGQQGHGGS